MLNIVLFLASVLIWGSTWYGITLQLGVVPMEWSLVYRFTIAAALILLYCKIRGMNLKFPREAHMTFLAFGVLMFSVNYYLSYLGTSYLTSGLVALVFSLLTPMNVINNRIFLKHPMSPKVVLATVMGLLGVGLVFGPDVAANGSSEGVAFGVVIALSASYVASLGNTWAASERAKALPLLPKTGWGMAYGTLFLVAWALFAGNAPAFEMNTRYIGSLVYLAVFGSVVAFLSYLALINRIGSARAGYFAVLMPVVALIISTIMEGYHWTVWGFVGVGLVLAGNVIVLRDKTQA